MKTLSPDLKARYFAITVGLTYVVAILLAMGINGKAFASDLDPRSELEQMIEAHIDTELRNIGELLACRILNDGSCDEPSVASASPIREMLLADGQQAEPSRTTRREDAMRQDNSELQAFE